MGSRVTSRVRNLRNDAACHAGSSAAMAEMTKKRLVELCRATKGYSTPSLNDRLYLQYKGFRRIENLEEYTGVRVLWLEGNGIRTIEGLADKPELTTLYLHENLIDAMQGMDTCVRAPGGRAGGAGLGLVRCCVARCVFRVPAAGSHRTVP